MFFWWCLIVAFGDTTVLSSVLQFQGVVFMSVASSACLRYVEQPVQFFLHRCAFSGRAAELRAQSINCVTPCVCGHRALLCKHKAKCFRKQSLQVVKLEVEKHHSRRQNEVLKSFSCSHSALSLFGCLVETQPSGTFWSTLILQRHWQPWQNHRCTVHTHELFLSKTHSHFTQRNIGRPERDCIIKFLVPAS